MTRRLALIVSLGSLITCRVAAAPDSGELLAQAARFPVVTIPLTAAAPVIDGRVEPSEWDGAALLPNGMTLSARRHEGTAPRYRTKVWLQYTAEALHIALQADYPEWVESPAVVSEKHDQTTGGESHFDLFLSPTDAENPGECWHICGNAAGVMLDRHLSDAAIGPAWNPPTEYQAQRRGHGWEAEFKLPFAALGVAPPKPGSYWRGNVFFIRLRPGRLMSTWSPWVEWRQQQETRGYGWLRFGRDDTAVRFEQGVEAADRMPATIRLTGSASDAVTVQLELLRRTDSFTAGQPSMMMNLARWHSERNVGGAAFLGMSTEQIIAAVSERFEPVQPPLVRVVPAAQGEPLRLPLTPALGEYLLRYAMTRPSDAGETEILAAGALSYRIVPELDLDLKPLLLTAGLLEVNVDYSNLKALQRARSLELTIRRQDTDAVVFEAPRPITGVEPLTVTVPGQTIPTGVYTVAAAARDDAKAELARLETTFERPPLPSWWTEPVGEMTAVPAPWTPMQISQAPDTGEVTVSVWGRDYGFRGLPVPASVVTTPARYSTGEAARPPTELLAAPMALALQLPDGPCSLESRPLVIAARNDLKVVLTSESRTDGIVIRGTTTIEFDGFMRIDLEIAPATEASDVAALALVIPFKREVATLFGNFRNAPGPEPTSSRHLGFLPELPWRHPVNYAQTLGTDRVGLQWICDSMRDWRQNKPGESMELRRNGASVEEVFHFIDHPVKLARPLRISFGLMALPVKPLPDKWGRLRITSSSFRPPAPDDTEAVAAYRRRAARVRPDIEIDHNPGWSGTPWFPYLFQDPAAESVLRARVDLAHEVGLRYCPHSGWQSISTLIPEWPAFAKEMGIEPETETLGKSVFACYNTPYSKFTAYLWDHHARTLGIDGIKADTMFPQTPCASLYHDCGWRDERGKLWPSVNLFATREFFKRLYQVFHGGARPNGITNAAQTGVPIAPVCSFTDIVNISEGSPYYAARSLKEGYPQDLVRTLMVGTLYGIVTIHDLKGAPLNANQRIAALLVAGADPRFMSHTHHHLPGYAKLPPNRFVMAAPSMEIWETWDWIDRGGQAIWMPHWENQDVLQATAPTTAAETPAEIYASLYLQPGKKAVLIVTNYEAESVLADISLDRAGLGFAADAQLQAEDAVTRVPIGITDGGLRLGVLSERYRLIRIWHGEPPRYADANLGPELLAGDFEQDAGRALSGAGSLKLDGAEKPTAMKLEPLTLERGHYVLQGAVLVTDQVAAGEIDAWGKRPYQSAATVTVGGQGTEFEPPQWLTIHAGKFLVEEQTPGWQHFLIDFSVVDSPATVTVQLTSKCEAWFDAFSLKAVQAQ